MFLGSVAQQVKVTQREPGGLYSQLFSGALGGTDWRLVVSRQSFCRDLLMQAGSTHIHPTLDLHTSEISLEGRGCKKCGVMGGSLWQLKANSSSCTKINPKRSVEVDLQSLTAWHLEQRLRRGAVKELPCEEMVMEMNHIQSARKLNCSC